MVYKAVFFDCFGVLTTDYWKDFVSKFDQQNIIEKLSEINRQLDAGFIDKNEFILEIEEITGLKPPEVETLKSNQIVKNSELLDYIRKLKLSGLKVGMISNISSNWVRESFLELSEQEMFDDMVFSYEVGVVKPDERIFNFAINRMNVEAHESIFIDDIELNCEIAAEIGFKSIHFVDNNQLYKEINKIIKE